MATSQDHKRVGNGGDAGPNTGGMGAYSPAPVDLLMKSHQRTMERIIWPTVKAWPLKAAHLYRFPLRRSDDRQAGQPEGD